jgi:hypothetical protein
VKPLGRNCGIKFAGKFSLQIGVFLPPESLILAPREELSSHLNEAALSFSPLSHGGCGCGRSFSTFCTAENPLSIKDPKQLRVDEVNPAFGVPALAKPILPVARQHPDEEPQTRVFLSFKEMPRDASAPPRFPPSLSDRDSHLAY